MSAPRFNIGLSEVTPWLSSSVPVKGDLYFDTRGSRLLEGHVMPELELSMARASNELPVALHFEPAMTPPTERPQLQVLIEPGGMVDGTTEDQEQEDVRQELFERLDQPVELLRWLATCDDEQIERLDLYSKLILARTLRSAVENDKAHRALPRAERRRLKSLADHLVHCFDSPDALRDPGRGPHFQARIQVRRPDDDNWQQDRQAGLYVLEPNDFRSVSGFIRWLRDVSNRILGSDAQRPDEESNP